MLGTKILKKKGTRVQVQYIFRVSFRIVNVIKQK